MDSFKETFSVRNLDENQIGHLMFVLNSPSYIDVFEPYLQNVKESFNNLLLDPSKKRKDEYPNDFLTGGIIAIDGLLSLFTKLINETEMERIARSQRELTPNQQYEVFRQGGMIKPASGLVKQEVSDEYDPNEDF